MKRNKFKPYVLLFIVVTLLSQVYRTSACTRVVYQGPNGTILTGRTLDWMEDLKTNLWIFPRGMHRDGAVGKNSVEWVSSYGSVVASGYEAGTADGMNEKGLVANLLYLSESDFGVWDENRPGITVMIWAQYVLDNFATVAEAVDFLSRDPFQIISPVLPNGSKSTLHLAISDPTGDNAIFEFIGGKLTVHHNRIYQVMTNSPTFDQQLALNAYWQSIGGETMLPGTNRAADRFVRASFYINTVVQTDDIYKAVAAVFSVINNCSVPYGVSTPGQPNIASTLWRTVADQKNRVYYFESVLSPNVFWVKLDDIDFSAGTDVKKLTMTDGEIYSGNTAGLFQKSEPFKYLSR